LIYVHKVRVLVAGRTIAEKILGRAANYPSAKAGDIVEASPDLVLSHENTFLVNKSFTEFELPRPWDPQKVLIVLDHRTPANTAQTAIVHNRIRALVKEYGIEHFFDVGEGICHQIAIEERFARPGMLILGSDSHTTTAGAVGAFATGIGATEMAGVWATGSIWLRVPRSLEMKSMQRTSRWSSRAGSARRARNTCPSSSWGRLFQILQLPAGWSCAT
jgi:homoaconitase/3-isopropylmalate dehydratase large subunit